MDKFRPPASPPQHRIDLSPMIKTKCIELSLRSLTGLAHSFFFFLFGPLAAYYGRTGRPGTPPA